MERYMTHARLCALHIFVLLVILWPTAAFGATIRVPADQPTIQAGIDAAGNGDTVLVADGTYTGEGNRNIDLKGKSITVRSENGPENAIIDCENSGSGFKFTGKDWDAGNSTISGFTVTNGGWGFRYEYETQFRVTITNSIFTGNSTGISCYHSSPTITDCVITANTSGGILCQQFTAGYNCSPIITNCIITYNTSHTSFEGGGGLYCKASSPSQCAPLLTNCTIAYNTATGNDWDDGGGGAYCYESNPTFVDCIISNNSAEQDGGGIRFEYSSGELRNCVIKHNTSTYNGGGIYCTNASATIRGCAIWQNESSSSGGGIYCTNASSIISGCTIWKNWALNSGGGMYCTDNSSPVITNCTFYRNSASRGDTIYCWRMNSSPTITNCILRPQGRAIETGSDDCNPVVTYTNIRWGYSGVGNIDADPLFEDVADADISDWDFHLRESSPCTDMGNNSAVPPDLTTDTDGNTRILDGDRNGTPTVDMGSDEFAAIYVPSEAGTIQAAIDQASNGYRVIVSNGVHSGTGNKDVDFSGKAIAVRSQNGPDNCVIDCENAGRGFLFRNGETSASVLEGFTVTNANTNYGGGIWCSDLSTPKIKNCIFSHNAVTMRGGAIYSQRASPKIDGCRIFNNSAEWSGGGISFRRSSPIITNTTLSGNTATAKGGAIEIWSDSFPTITNITITGNTAPDGGGIYFDNTSAGTVTNTIIWQNSPNEISGVGYGPTVTYSDIQGGYPGEGNLGLDPEFMDVSDPDPANWDLHLYATSPCIDTGDDNAPHLPYKDFEGETRKYSAYSIGTFVSPVDMGADEFTRLIRVPTDQPTIQAAIDQASDGYRISINSETYTGAGNKDIDFKGKTIMVYAREGPENCVIDCEGSGRGFWFHTGENQRALLYGFTIKNGTGTAGGGIDCSSYFGSPSSPTIQNCIISSCTAERGGGIRCNASSPTIKECMIVDNLATSYGGGIDCYSDSSPTVMNSIIISNAAQQYGGGIFVQSGELPIFNNCTVAYNSASENGGGIYCYYSSPTITNSIVWGNSMGQIRYENTSPTVTYCDVGGGYTGEGNINADPLSLDVSDPDPINWDLHLQCASPCIDAGNNSALGLPMTDIDGDLRIFDADSDGTLTVDMGVDEVILRRPTLNNGDVDPDTGDQNTIFRFTVDYYDPDGSWPIEKSVVIDGSAHSMDLLSGSRSDGTYYYDTLLRPGTQYYFSFSDPDVCPARLPSQGSYAGPSVSNDCPLLSNANVDPASGDTSTTFRFTVDYYDADGNSPTTTDVVINGYSYAMALLSGSAANGTYYYDTTLSPDTEYYFSFDDGYGCTTRLPSAGSYDGPSVTGITYYVPDDRPTIMTAVNDCYDYDTIIVRDGIYTGADNKNINLGGKIVTLRSEKGPAQCIIDCEGNGRGFYLESTEKSGSVIDGFTIMNGNTSDNGGGIYCGSNLTIKNCKIVGNTAYHGGGIYCHYSSPSIINCLISGNSANPSLGWGGGIHSYESHHGLTVFNCTITGNSAIYGGGIGSMPLFGPTSMQIVDSILWNNIATNGPQLGGYLRGATIDYSVVQGGQADIYGPFPINWGEGNMEDDPLFVDPDGADDISGNQDDDFHLEQGSPCIDAGTSEGAPETDLAGNDRFDDPETPNTGAGTYNYFDIGAYEYVIACEGDFDGDNDVDGSDLAVFAADFGRTDCTDDCEGDFDGDGDVDGSDLAVFAADFGRTDCPK